MEPLVTRPHPFLCFSWFVALDFVLCARYCEVIFLVGAPAWEKLAHPGGELLSEISSVLVVILQFQKREISCLRSGLKHLPL